MSTFSTLGFLPADILLPQTCDTRWSVVACDQYTSQPEYWERVDQFVGEAPSTLRLILPESKLEEPNVQEHIAKINENMDRYLEQDLFRVLPDSFIYVERTQDNGKIRYGLVGMVDLNCYDYRPGSGTLIRATEGTVLSRIPPRVAVRKNAPIELPHVMLLVDDPGRTVIEPLTAKKDQLPCAYDFDLMEQGGHIQGWQITGEQAAGVAGALAALADPETFGAKYDAPGAPVLLFAVGDGNHSLATAKENYEQAKKERPETAETARYALVELVNLHDNSLEFEPIHRVLFQVDPAAVLDAFLAYYPGAHLGEGEGHQIPYIMNGKRGVVTVPNPSHQLEVGTLQAFLDDYLAKTGGKVDYIHGDDTVAQLSGTADSMGFYLPAMGKDQLFKTVIKDGVLPRKTFSMGEAHDKRFYLECHKIR